MAKVVKRIRLAGSKGSVEMDVVFDDEFFYSCISPELARQLGQIISLPAPRRFKAVVEEGSLTAKECVILGFYINGYRFSDEFMVIPDLPQEAIIGELTLRKWRMQLDTGRKEVIFDPDVTKLRLL